jgi:hypothetical protein
VSIFPIVRAKNVIIARIIGEAPVWREKFPIAKYANMTIMTPESTQTMSPVRRIMRIPTASYFGGPRSSSGVSLSMFSSDTIEEYDEKCSDRDKYICKIQNSKVFYRDEIDNISDEDTLIGVRKSSSDDESVSCIEKKGSLRIFFMKIIPDESCYQYECDYLKGKTRDRKRESDSRIKRKLESEIFSYNREVWKYACFNSEIHTWIRTHFSGS